MNAVELNEELNEESNLESNLEANVESNVEFNERVTFRRRSTDPKFWSQRRFGGVCPLLAFRQHLLW